MQMVCRDCKVPLDFKEQLASKERWEIRDQRDW